MYQGEGSGSSFAAGEAHGAILTIEGIRDELRLLPTLLGALGDVEPVDGADLGVNQINEGQTVHEVHLSWTL